MEIKLKTKEGLVDPIIEIVDGVMVVSPKEQSNYADFKDGDVIVCGWSDSEWICILKGEVDTIGSTNYFAEDYCGMYFKGQGSDKEVWIEASYSDSATFIRPATEEEKKKFFDKLAKEGYKWDAEKKELVRLRWKPLLGQLYHRPSFYAAEIKVSKICWREDEVDIGYYNKGWCFKTKEECQAFCDKLNESVNSVKP